MTLNGIDYSKNPSNRLAYVVAVGGRALVTVVCNSGYVESLEYCVGRQRPKNSHLREFRCSTTSHLLYSQLLKLRFQLIELFSKLDLVLCP